MTELNEKVCFVCEDFSNSQIITYQHTCGKYYIHQSCLDNWVKEYGTSCIICRKDIIISSSDESNDESSYDIENGSIRSYSPILNDDDIINVRNNRYCKYISNDLLIYIIYIVICILVILFIHLLF